MKRTICLILAMVFCAGIGCSGISHTERENFTRPEAREKYIVSHPECKHEVHIRNGEIIRGMDIYEVMASWGLPNVYLASTDEPKEFWIYYVQQKDTKTVIIYTLTFDNNCLEGWDIDQKRFDDYRIVSETKLSTEEPGDVGTMRKKF